MMNEESNKSVENLLAPKSVAVIGVSQREGSLGRGIFQNIIQGNFLGIVYAVNPNLDQFEGGKVYADVLSIPNAVDMAVICVPQKHVLTVLKQCGERKVKAAILITAGYGEMGANGKKLEEAVLKLAKEYSIRLLGPNCMGIINTSPKTSLNATFSPVFPPKGNVALISQSGSLGQAILDYASSLGIGISHFISIGNRIDFEESEILKFLGNDVQTDVILLYMEDYSNAQSMIPISRKISEWKPLIALNGGNQDSSFFKEAGIQWVHSLDELFGLTSLISSQRMPKGNRLGIMTNAGGPSHLAAKRAKEKGLTLPSLSEKSLSLLKEILPSEALLGNPLDMISTATPEQYAKVLKILHDDENIDAILAIFIPPVNQNPSEYMQALVRASRDFLDPKPILTNFLMSSGRRDLLENFGEKRLPIFSFPEQAIDALSLFLQLENQGSN